MQKQFVTHEIALALKELGFDEPCLKYWLKENNLQNASFNWGKEKGYYTNSHINKYIDPEVNSCTAPLWQQAIDWFREEYNLNIWISCTSWLNSYTFHYNWNSDIINDSTKYAKYEDCRGQAILKAIELCQNLQNIQHTE